MDRYHSRPSCAKRAGVAKRFDGCRMGAAGAAASGGVGSWASAQVAVAAHRRGDPVSAARRPAMADAATLLSSGLHGSALVLPVARQRPVAVDQPRPAADGARNGRARGFAQCRGDRQSEREDDGKRRSLRLRCGEKDQGAQPPPRTLLALNKSLARPTRRARCAARWSCRTGSWRGGDIRGQVRPGGHRRHRYDR